MSDEQKFSSWEEVIVDFFENKIPKSKLFKARKFIEDKNTAIEEEKESKKIEKLKLAKDKKQQELLQLRKNYSAGEIRDWIEKSHEEAKKSTVKTIKATHVLKFTHSSSNPGGLLLGKKSDDLLVSTSSLKRKLTLDLAHKNGAHISISRFLALQLSENMIIDLILIDKFIFLEPFAKDKVQFKKWETAFSNYVEIREMKIADKAKQLYYPLTQYGETYHLIVPLFASSLCNEVDTVINNLKYKEQKEINKYRNHKKDNKKSPQYHQSLYIDYPNLAAQNFGGEHAKNVSMLNANRSGKVYLFSTQPPTWQSQLKPPIYKKSIFDSYYHPENTTDNIKYLVDFILRNESIDLSTRDPEKQKWLEKWTTYIINDFWLFVGNIHELASGWSSEKGTKLKVEHQYLLDPYRKDNQFQTNRKDNAWQKVVVNDFSIWLNKQLKKKDKKFTAQAEYSRTWKKLMEKELREYNQIISADTDLEVGV